MPELFADLPKDPNTVLDTTGTTPAINRNLDNGEWDLKISSSSTHPLPHLIGIPVPETIASGETPKA